MGVQLRLAESLALTLPERATARIARVDKDAVCDWLNRAAQYYCVMLLYLWSNLYAVGRRLDELWSSVTQRSAIGSTLRRVLAPCA